jgi:hypothetical protein
LYTGTQKKAIVLKNNENCMFESAYFILKDDYQAVKESDMIREENNILKNKIIGGYFSCPNENPPKETSASGIVCFLTGSLFSFILCSVIFLLLK